MARVFKGELLLPTPEDVLETVSDARAEVGVGSARVAAAGVEVIASKAAACGAAAVVGLKLLPRPVGRDDLAVGIDDGDVGRQRVEHGAVQLLTARKSCAALISDARQ